LRSTAPTPTGEGSDNGWILHGPLELAADSDAPASSRAFVAALGPIGLDGVTDTVVLLVSELVTNVVRHTPCDSLALLVLVADDLVRVEVSDGDGTRFPHIAPLRPTEPGGLGLRLVDTLSSRWGVTATERGKCVWFDIAVADTPTPRT
jgi:hypothetical protein